MLSARYSPLISQAEITGKAQPDLWSFARRQGVSDDPMCKAYPGGDHKENLAIMPGELVVGYRKRRGNTSFHGRSQEAGFSSVAGLPQADHQSIESFMRDLYFMGVAKTEYQYGGESLFGTDPMDHGFGFLRSGSISVNNNSGEDIYAGDILGWKVPNFRNGAPRTQGNNQPLSLDTGLNPRYSNNRTGTPYGKQLIEIERFDPSDFSFQLAGSYALFDLPASQGGIQDLGPEELFSDKKMLSSLQEEALGWQYGLLMAYARGLTATGGDGKKWFEDNAGDRLSDEGREVLNAMFLRNVEPGQNGMAIADFGDFNNPRNTYKFYADHMFDMLCGAVAGGWYAKASRVVGKAMGNAKNTQTLDAMFSHFKVGF